MIDRTDYVGRPATPTALGLKSGQPLVTSLPGPTKGLCVRHLQGSIEFVGRKVDMNQVGEIRIEVDAAGIKIRDLAIVRRRGSADQDMKPGLSGPQSAHQLGME